MKMMKFTKRQIIKLRKALDEANYFERKSQESAKDLAELITELTKVNGFVDYLQGDGFGFTPQSNNDTHILISDLIKHFEMGYDITEKFILDNLIY
jgi:hypothetical protein